MQSIEAVGRRPKAVEELALPGRGGGTAKRWVRGKEAQLPVPSSVICFANATFPVWGRLGCELFYGLRPTD